MISQPEIYNILNPQKSIPSEGERSLEIQLLEKVRLTRSQGGERVKDLSKKNYQRQSMVFIGSIEDFLNFFVKRNPEIRDFTKKYQEIEETNDLERLNSIICPQFILSINKEAQNPATLFKMAFSSFNEFYGQTLRAYNGYLSLEKS